jgi:hypothetical protein
VFRGDIAIQRFLPTQYSGDLASKGLLRVVRKQGQGKLQIDLVRDTLQSSAPPRKRPSKPLDMVSSAWGVVTFAGNVLPETEEIAEAMVRGFGRSPAFRTAPFQCGMKPMRVASPPYAKFWGKTPLSN